MPNRLRVMHRATAPCRETVAIDVNDIDIAGSLCNPLFKNSHALVNQCKNQSIDDFLSINLATLHSGSSCKQGNLCTKLSASRGAIRRGSGGRTPA